MGSSHSVRAAVVSPIARAVLLVRHGAHAAKPWREAREAFSAGMQKSPRDARFLVERAGAEYRLQDFPGRQIGSACGIALSAEDEYALNFLGTIYLLEGNLEAALKYWNDGGKTAARARDAHSKTSGEREVGLARTRV